MFDSSRTTEAKELMAFPSACPSCGVDVRVKMCVTDVPHFKEVILMAMLCDECGFREVEVKGGGAIPAQGTRQVLYVGGEEAVRRARAVTEAAAKAQEEAAKAASGGAGAEAPIGAAATMAAGSAADAGAGLAELLGSQVGSPLAPDGKPMSVGEAVKLDLGRDVIKSDTALVEVPDVGLVMQHGTLGGLYTTVEGLLEKIAEQLDSSNPF